MFQETNCQKKEYVKSKTSTQIKVQQATK